MQEKEGICKDDDDMVMDDDRHTWLGTKNGKKSGVMSFLS